jgi:hypothetical protein
LLDLPDDLLADGEQLPAAEELFRRHLASTSHRSLRVIWKILFVGPAPARAELGLLMRAVCAPRLQHTADEEWLKQGRAHGSLIPGDDAVQWDIPLYAMVARLLPSTSSV